MSHFIENTYDLQSEPVLKTVSKQIVIPPLSSIKHGSNEGGCDGEGEKKMLKLMFFQLQNSEMEKIHQQNSLQMRKQFQQLRSKLAKRGKYETMQKAMDRKERLPKLQLSDIIKMNPQKIDLLKKHRTKIYGKLSVFHQAENISKEKQSYHNWYNTTKNSPLHSPIFTKMNYLLEKVSSKENNQRSLLINQTLRSQTKSNPVLVSKIKDPNFISDKE